MGIPFQIVDENREIAWREPVQTVCFTDSLYDSGTKNQV